MRQHATTFQPQLLTRRQACQQIVGTAAGVALAIRPRHANAAAEPFRLSYILGSCMYGETALAEILPEVRKVGAAHIDVWPRVHGNQREQVDEMGEDAFALLLEEHEVRLGILTRYDLGPFGLAPELPFAAKFGCPIIITGSRGPRGLKGDELKSAVGKFVEQMKPHATAAAEHGVKIGIENHSSALIESPDAIRWLAELSGSMPLGIGLAPYHLPQDPAVLAQLIEDLGEKLFHFYGWEHGMGCHEKLPKEQEMLQMPGYGRLDFSPMLQALEKIGYAGWTEVFMHPVPRGIPILETTAKVSSAINTSRAHLEDCLRQA